MTINNAPPSTATNLNLNSYHGERLALGVFRDASANSIDTYAQKLFRDITNGNCTNGLSEERILALRKSYTNKPVYMKSKNTIVNMFFDLRVTNCNNKYMSLFEHTPSPNKNYEDDLCFYAALCGEKNDVQHGILNSLLICLWEYNL